VIFWNLCWHFRINEIYLLVVTTRVQIYFCKIKQKILNGFWEIYVHCPRRTMHTLWCYCISWSSGLKSQSHINRKSIRSIIIVNVVILIMSYITYVTHDVVWYLCICIYITFILTHPEYMLIWSRNHIGLSGHCCNSLDTTWQMCHKRTFQKIVTNTPQRYLSICNNFYN
jgi:hypothetical protein